jgi:hypothetical protein
MFVQLVKRTKLVIVERQSFYIAGCAPPLGVD